MRETAAFITEDPLSFEFDPDTGLVSVIFVSSWQVPGSETLMKRTMRLMLTPASSQALLDNLPALQSILELAKKGPTKPRSVQ